MILFTSLIFFPHLSAVRLNMWTEITLFADMFTRGFLLFLFSLALQHEKYDVGEEGDDIDVSFDYILFFLFRIFARTEVARVSILDRNKVAVSRNLFASFPRWKFESRGNIFPPLVPGYARLQTRSSRVV